MMHMTIRRYETATGAPGRTSTGTTEDVVEAGRWLAAILGRLPGFVSFVILETDGGGLVTICTFEHRPGLEEADRLAAGLRAECPPRCATEGETITGRIVFQRGL